MADDRILVPVEETVTLRSTVAYVATTAAEEETSSIHFVYLASWHEDDPHAAGRRADAVNLLEQVAVWARYDLEEAGADDVDIETDVLGSDAYLFGPAEFAERLHDHADEHGIDTVILDPEYTPVGNTTLLQPLEFELASTDLSVREAPVDRPSRRERLVHEATGPRFAALFGLSLAFYLVLGDVTYWFDWLTGIATGLIVAVTLSTVSLDHDPTIVETPKRLLRGGIYVPVLLVEIVKSNLIVAAVILHPSLPIDPTMTRMRVLVGSGLPLTSLANGITLTPGTLTVRARDEDLYVHTLIPWAREGLFEGSLERWTRFVFYGREAARLPTPIERDDCAVLQGPDADEDMPFLRADGGSTVGDCAVASTENDDREGSDCDRRTDDSEVRDA